MNLIDVDLNLLKVFEALYIVKNVTRAAERLEVAQSSLSSSLKRLRVLFQDELFVRSSLGMRPTNRAIVIEPAITDCLRAARAAIVLPDEFDPSTSCRTFVIGGSDFSAFSLLPRLIKFLKRTSPHIRLEMKPIPPNQITQFLDNGTVHFAVGSGGHYPKRILSRKLFDEDMVIIARKNHPILGDTDRLSIKKYTSLQHIYITSKEEGERIIDRELRKRSLQRDVYLRVQNFLVVPYIVEKTDLIATISERVAYQCSNSSQLIMFPYPTKIDKNVFRLLWGKVNNSDQECMWLINSIADLFSSTDKTHS